MSWLLALTETPGCTLMTPHVMYVCSYTAFRMPPGETDNVVPADFNGDQHVYEARSAVFPDILALRFPPHHPFSRNSHDGQEE